MSDDDGCETGDRPRGPRRSCTPRRRCSAAARPLRRRAEHAHVCPVCLGHPGRAAGAQRARRSTQALADRRSRSAATIAGAVASSPARTTSIPTCPKGYQISQYDEPLCARRAPRPRRRAAIGITRAHLEEDAGKIVHDGGAGGRIAGADSSIVDFNRCRHAARRDRDRARHPHAASRRGVPRPAASTRCQTSASPTATWRRARCAATPTSRCGARGETTLGTKTELKNMNSFRFLERGIDGRDPSARSRCSRRRRGRARRRCTTTRRAASCTRCARRRRRDDYRYFPEPDLVPLEPRAGTVDALRGGAARAAAGADRAASATTYGLSRSDAADAGRRRRRPPPTSRTVAAARGDAQGRGQLGHGRARRAAQRDRLEPRSPVTPSGWPACRARRRRHAVVDGREAGVRGDARASPRRRGRAVDGSGLARSATVDALGRSSTRCWPPTRPRSSSTAAASSADQLLHRPGDEADARPRGARQVQQLLRDRLPRSAIRGRLGASAPRRSTRRRHATPRAAWTQALLITPARRRSRPRSSRPRRCRCPHHRSPSSRRAGAGARAA